MHQEHNIPWNLLAQNLKFVPEDPERHTNNATLSSAAICRETGFFARAGGGGGAPLQASQLNHFARVLRDTVGAFAKTEREKYPEKEKVDVATLPDWGDGPGMLYSEEALRRHSEFLTSRGRDVRNWIALAQRFSWSEDELSYDTGQGDLADVVKYLMSENEIEKLLFLARHPGIPLHTLRHLSWGHHFGFSYVLESALLAYIFFNVCAAMNVLEDGSYARTRWYDFMIRTLNRSMDYSAQQIPHRRFYFPDGGAVCQSKPQPHRDLPRLREYLRELFGLLYRYEMICRECGLESRLESEAVWTINSMVSGRGVKLEHGDGGAIWFR